MARPSAAALLDAWERGLPLRPDQRALLLLTLAFPDEPAETLAGWPLGRRNAALLTLREQLFGVMLGAVARCPACGHALEIPVAVAEIRAPMAETERVDLRVASDAGDYVLEARLPTSADLAAVADAPSLPALLTQCVSTVRLNGESVAAHPLPAPVLDALAQALEEADPQATILLALTCAACSYGWTAPLDVVDYLWQEIHDYAQKTLWEVHLLAQAYGWSERAILDLSDRRRRQYLALVTGD